jgi:hypothetical protein
VEDLYDTIGVVAYALARATHDDKRVLAAFLTDDDLGKARDHAPSGIIDPRSWGTATPRSCTIPRRRRRGGRRDATASHSGRVALFRSSQDSSWCLILARPTT